MIKFNKFCYNTNNLHKPQGEVADPAKAEPSFLKSFCSQNAKHDDYKKQLRDSHFISFAGIILATGAVTLWLSPIKVILSKKYKILKIFKLDVSSISSYVKSRLTSKQILLAFFYALLSFFIISNFSGCSMTKAMTNYIQKV